MDQHGCEARQSNGVLQGPFSINRFTRSHNCAVSAAGTALLRLSLRKPFNSLHIQGPINALYAKSINSYMDEELFYNWLSKHVIVLQTYHLSKEY